VLVVSVIPMRAKAFLLPLVFVLVAVLTGCASRKPKSSSRIYEGESPSIRYSSERETAGGALER
jgi:uncharacterized protein YceK